MEWAKNGWEVVIGLETHTQLKTNTKIFSGAIFAREYAYPGVYDVDHVDCVSCEPAAAMEQSFRCCEYQDRK